MTLAPETYDVAELLRRVGEAVASAFPGPVWVRGEISGYRRTAGGAAFFRLADSDEERQAVDVAARGVVMLDVDRRLDAVGIGALRDGVAVRLRGTIGVDGSRSTVRLSLLEVDPNFTAGRLANDRQEVLRRLVADGTLGANGRLELPLVPLRVGLVTSRGSAAHADFIEHLGQSRYRFSVRTVHASMQGWEAAASITRALGRLAAEQLDVAVIVRGGGSRLDLATFDDEGLCRAVAAMPFPVVAGIGHEIDRSVVDEAAAVSVKTPTAAAEWLVGRVADYSGRIDTARRLIADDARAACTRALRQVDHAAAQLAGVRATIGRHRDVVTALSAAIADDSRRAVLGHSHTLDMLEQMLETLGIEATLGRGFALVTDSGGAVIRSAAMVRAGDRLSVRFSDGIISTRVEENGA